MNLKMLLGMACLSPLLVMSEERPILSRGETIALAGPEGYEHYQWQVSSDCQSFIDIPGATQKDLKMSVFAPGYYRVIAVSGSGASVIPDTTDIAFQQVDYANETVLSAAHGYVETLEGAPGATGINIPEEVRENGQAQVTRKLIDWISGNAMAVYYFNHPQGVIDTQMKLTVKKDAEVSFRITLWDPVDATEPMAVNYIALKGTGEAQVVDILGINIPRKDYYRYQIECLKGWQDIREIDRFFVHSDQAAVSYKAGWLSSPSVHLSNWRNSKSDAPKGAVYDWCYQEVMMPATSDIIGTYVMSLGVLSGYMGIQMNGYDENGQSKHEVLYSMWDDGSTDEDPDLPMYCRASVVDHDPKATVNRFGGEGTGMQTYYRGHHWECGTYVQFLTNCRPETATYTTVVNGVEQTHTQQNMLVSTWFNAQDGKGWQYMSTLRLPNNNRYFDSWYSFLENYNWSTGQAVRQGFYRNGYGRAKDQKKWYHFNMVDFGHTDGGNNPGNRNDYGQGVSETETGAFFMQTGGYLPAIQKSNVVALNVQNTPVDTIDLARLEARVDEAIAREKELIEAEEQFNKNKLDKTAWTIMDKSSEETSGEGENGRAALIVDGDLNTYWHSQWTGSGSSYPHHITVDMKQENVVEGFQMTMSGGTNRYVKSYRLYGSTDNKEWELIFADDDAPAEAASFRVLLDDSFIARYLKLEILDGRATDGPHVRINELDVSGRQNPTSVALSPDAFSDYRLKPILKNGILEFSAPFSCENLMVAFYDFSGRCLAERMFTGVVSGQNFHWNHTAFQGKTSGILVCKSGKRIRVARTISVGYQ